LQRLIRPGPDSHEAGWHGATELADARPDRLPSWHAKGRTFVVGTDLPADPDPGCAGLSSAHRPFHSARVIRTHGEQDRTPAKDRGTNARGEINDRCVIGYVDEKDGCPLAQRRNERRGVRRCRQDADPDGCRQ
jgi:hypothetical protein